MSATTPSLSIIIPSFNEELRLPTTLEKIAVFLRGQYSDAEVIVVDDGSTDRTVAVAESYADKIPNLRVLSNGQNRGKGFSVRHGSLEARGSVILFTDADLSAPIDEAPKLLSALKQHDVAIGSRAVDRSLIEVHESPFREFAGIIFNRIVRTILRLPFVDTQCGFKAYTDEAAQRIFAASRTMGWGFDVESLALATRMGYRIKEVPVRWVNDTRSHVRFSGGLQFLGEVCTIRWRLWRKEYRY